MTRQPEAPTRARLPQTATVHERTVQQAAEGLRAVPRTRATPRGRAPVYRVKVDPRVWRTALALADRDVARLEVRSATEVVVHNTADRASEVKRTAYRGNAAA